MPSPHDELNAQQREAVFHGLTSDAIDPEAPALLIIAGAGSGKTHTLAHRVAQLVLHGADPRRICLLTFTRRAASEMTRRAQRIVTASTAHAEGRARAGRIQWSGTFHAIANRLLRYHADGVGLDPAFTVLDRADAADLLDLLRGELGLARKASRFPRKATCLSIYSHVVNAQCQIDDTLQRHFPWCQDWTDDLRGLFAAYTEEKQKRHTLDYDDLLLYWYHLMAEPALAGQVRERFDHVLVDEYQDTNALQAGILLAMRPAGHGLSVVGDDAQAIYGFRAASVRNILDFPSQFEQPARVIALQQNYRSTRPILAACNAVIDLASEGFTKRLFSLRSSQQKPILATVEDESDQVEYVVERVLEHREAGIALKKQAVLIRTTHHSDALEVELGRRNIPFVKFGGLKFLEAAHVKDLLCVLRWAENPRDGVAGFRVLQILPGVGPAHARRALAYLERRASDLGSLASYRPPGPAAEDWPGLCKTLVQLRDATTDWSGQVGIARRWYEPHLLRLYDAAPVRAGDLEQLEQIAAGYPSRERFLSELALDPPSGTGDEAGPPHLDEDYLILSTIHSAKGQEWDVVYVLNAADGCIPSDMATGSPEQIEEERRLLYVAMTRARDQLHVIHPLRFFARHQHRHGDRHVFTPRSRFVPDSILGHFERQSFGRRAQLLDGTGRKPAVSVDVGARLRAMWG
jgi:DNA helicase-2/ATP-dependent DNA helicase PcrA